MLKLAYNGTRATERAASFSIAASTSLKNTRILDSHPNVKPEKGKKGKKGIWGTKIDNLKTYD